MSPAPESTLDDPQQVIADLRRANDELRRRLDERTAERDEALAQQTASAEVLGLINSSAGDLAPVFQAILERAARLCSAGFGSLWIYELQQFRAAAVYAVPEALSEFFRRPVPVEDAASLVAIVRGQNVVHVPDLAASELYRAGNVVRRAYVDLGGARTLLSVALRKENALLGAFNIYRQEVRPFSENEVKLIENFAAQAVIAMENARLITETREALEQQTATAEVLQVINSSPGDLAPVFDAMLEKALRLCGSDLGNLLTYDGECFEAAAGAYGSDWVGPERELSRAPIRPIPGGLLDRLVAGEHFIHTEDVRTDAAYHRNPGSGFRDLVDGGGYQSMTHVALRRESHLLGAIVIFFKEQRRLTDKQIGLLQNFAAQAVIAMENARLLGELRDLPAPPCR